MNDVISVQLAISKLHMESLLEQEPSNSVATQALAELNTALAELEAVNDELMNQNEALVEVTLAHEVTARRYKELFEHVPVPYLITDSWGVMEEANTAAEEMLGVRRELLRGKPISVFVPPSERRAFRDSINSVNDRRAWQIVFQPRGRDRMDVHIDVALLPTNKPGEQRLGWVLQNLTPQLAAASASKMLERETALRVESQAAILRLRALHIGLETMAHDADLPIRHRITSLLDALVPRFAQQITCILPNEGDTPLTVGLSNGGEQVLQTVVVGPNKGTGRLIAKRNSPFMAEDGAILQSAANGVSLLLYSARSEVFARPKQSTQQ
jgi:PAS domain S-box-containing protein